MKRRINNNENISETKAMIQALDNTGIRMFMYYPQTRTISVPQNTCEAYGCKVFYDNMPHSFADDFVFENDHDEFKEMYYKIDRGEEKASATFHDKDLKYYIHVTLTTISWTADGKPENVFGLIENLSDLYRNERIVDQLQVQLDAYGFEDNYEDALKTMASSIGNQYDAVFYFWLDSHMYVCFQEKQPSVLSIVEKKGRYEKVWDTYISNVIEENDQAGIREFIDIDTLPERIGDKNSLTYSYRRKKMGWTRGKFIVGKRDKNGKPLTVIYTVADINEEIDAKIGHQRAEYEALHDSLTLVGNRNAFKALVEDSNFKNKSVGLVLFDIDRFKSVNDQFGHEVGDQVIIATAQEMKKLMRQKDKVFRMGGDEFAILLYDCDTSVWDSFCQKIKKFHENLKQILPFEMGITISSGICVNQNGYCDEMYTLVDKAMYNTKQNGRGGCSLIDLKGNIVREWHDQSESLKNGDARIFELTYDREEAQRILQIQKEAISSVLDTELISVSVIDKNTGTSRVIQSRYLINTNQIYNFDEGMKREAEHIFASDRQKFLENSTLDNVNKKLEKDGRYDITAFLQLPISEEFRRIRYHFSYNEKYPKYILSVTEDITNHYIFDPITGMKNFNGLKLDCMKVINQGNLKQYVVMNFNIVNFKAVNTMYGYEAGNALLKQVFMNLLTAEIPFASVCRENADNFFCLCRKEDYDYYAIDRICKMKVSGVYGITESIELFCGVYFIDNDESLDIICDKARLAKRYAEKEIGVNAFVLDESDKQKYLNEAIILASIPKAINNKELVVYYQPIYDAQSGKLASAEALIRWQHPEKGLIQPNLFIPAVEKTGQIVDIDVYVGKCVQQFQNQRFMSGEKMVPISINISRYDFLQERYMKCVGAIMRENPQIANMLRIEITESGLINIPDSGEAFIHEMRCLGIQTMIDDFGTGYSSLASVTDHPCDVIKLDMTFARHIGVEEKMEVLIRSTIETAHHMGVTVVAEGVETKEQYEFLKKNSCDYIQGYYFSKPISQGEFESLLDSSL